MSFSNIGKTVWRRLAGNRGLLFVIGGAIAIMASLLFGLAAAAMTVSSPPASEPYIQAAPPPDDGEKACLVCHASRGLVLAFSGGEKLDLDLDQERYLSSVHGGKLTCTDCHRGYGTAPHGPVFSQDRRDYAGDNYEICKRCHFANYTRTLDSIHYKVLEAGNPKSALCTDCHSAHYVTRPSESRGGISQTCAKCHDDIYREYRESVHGAALVKEGNNDVPVCTDCHGVHNIYDPRTVAFHLNIPALCDRCHGDEKLMSKYGLSTAVTKTYLEDFHGVTTTLLAEQSSVAFIKQPVCTDCHGIHNIARTDAPDSPVIRQNLVKTCRQCHPDATENFPAAWLSHYEPSLSQAPLVWLVDIFYKIFIPFMVGGIVMNVLVDLYRVLSGRK
ncbi:MAG: cytochrome c3 family protein [Chloroflexota bacterium]